MKTRYKLLISFLVLLILLYYGYLARPIVDLLYHVVVNTIEDAIFDEEGVTSEISKSIIKGNIEIVTEYSNSSSGYGYKQEAHGSGVVLYENQNSYYALTNYHVVANRNEYSYRYTKVIDYYGVNYDASVLVKDINYDLAIIRFAKSNRQLTPLEFVCEDPSIWSKVIAIGQPKGERNVITYGRVIGYDTHELEDESTSNVNFTVLEHNAKVESGNSGGVLLNLDYKVVGINYAAGVDKDGDFVYGLAIPATKIIEYFNEHKYYLKKDC